MGEKEENSRERRRRKRRSTWRKGKKIWEKKERREIKVKNNLKCKKNALNVRFIFSWEQLIVVFWENSNCMEFEKNGKHWIKKELYKLKKKTFITFGWLISIQVKVKLFSTFFDKNAQIHLATALKVFFDTFKKNWAFFIFIFKLIQIFAFICIDQITNICKCKCKPEIFCQNRSWWLSKYSSWNTEFWNVKFVKIPWK